MNETVCDARTLIPAVKERKIGHGKTFIKKIVCSGDGETAAFAVAYLNVFLKDIAEIGEEENADLFLAVGDGLEKGAYRLGVGEKIFVGYGDGQGVRNALATLIQLIDVTDGGYSVQRQEIYDFPDCDFRSVMIDLARGLPDAERLKEDMRRLSLAKCDYIHLHIMDMMGVCYESDVLKMTEGIRGTKLYSKDDLKGLVAYCEGLGIELIPDFEIPAHAYYLTTHNEKLACKTGEQDRSPQVVCAGSEETYEFFDALISELTEIFPSKYLHMCGDELYFDDFPDWKYYPNWMKCETCLEVMKKNGYTSVKELYYYVVLRIYDIVRAHGKTMIIFNDQLDVSEPLPLPKDIVIQFWRVSDKNRGPRAGCSYEKFLEQGYRVICSPFEYCYIDIEEYANPEKTSYFDFKNYQGTAKYKDLVLGGEACAWEYGNPEYTHYKFSFAPAAILLAAKMWDGRGAVYDRAYRVALSRLILGNGVPENYEFLELFGSIMPPRLNGKVSYASKENALIDEEILEKHEKALRSVSRTYGEIYLQALKELIETF